MEKEIIMIVGDWNYPRMVYNSLKNEFNINTIIIDRGENKLKILKGRVKKLGFTRVLGQVLFRIIAVPYINVTAKKRIDDILKRYNIIDAPFDKEKIIEVSSINSNEGQNLLKKLNPDIVIIVTTRIISKETLRLTKAKFINIHAGITPLYRGWHGAYWALINKDYKNCGVTVHFVDEGIDTGNILYQDTIIDIITPKDNLMSYTILQLTKAIPLLKRALKDIQEDIIKIKKTKKTKKQKLYYQPTLWFYLFNRWFKGIK
jgi:methionyl-tRNA formyltransferase